MFVSVCVHVCMHVCVCVYENKQNTPDRVFMFAHVYVQV